MDNSPLVRTKKLNLQSPSPGRPGETTSKKETHLRINSTAKISDEGLQLKEIHSTMLPKKDPLISEKKKPPTPASILALRAGIDPSMVEEESQGSVEEKQQYRLTLAKIAEEKLDHIQEAVATFDAQNFILQTIDERIAPLVRRTSSFMTGLTDLKQRFNDLSFDYKEKTHDYESRFNQLVTFAEFKDRVQTIEKRMTAEHSTMWLQITESKEKLELHDSMLARNEKHIDQIEQQMNNLNKGMKETIKYANQQMVNVEVMAQNLFKSIHESHKELADKFADLEQRQGENRLVLDTHSKEISNYDRDIKLLGKKIEQEHIRQNLSSTKKVTALKRYFEKNQIEVGQMLADQFQFMFRRMRHKLLYQMGLTDDPWQERREYVVDDVFSQDPNDPGDILKIKRSQSFDIFTGFGKRPLKKQNGELALIPKRKSSAHEKVGKAHRKLVKPQKKYHTKANKGARGKEELGDSSDAQLEVGNQIKFIFAEDKKKGAKQQIVDQHQAKQFERTVLEKIAQLEIQQQQSQSKAPSSTFRKAIGSTGPKISQRNSPMQLTSPHGNQKKLPFKPQLTNRGPPKRNEEIERQELKVTARKEKKPKPLQLQKNKFKEDTLIYLRTVRNQTFRTRALKLIDQTKKDFMHELDEQDRYFQERKGIAQLNALKVNPHRVQMFSINEIWHCMQQRLIELNIMKDPEVDSFGSASDSTEYEDDFDFVKLGLERAGFLFRGKNNKDKNEKSVAEMMRRNDLKILNRQLEKTIEHERILLANSEEFLGIKAELQDNKSFQHDTHSFMAKVEDKLKDLQQQLYLTDSKINIFKDDYFPSYMRTMRKDLVQEVAQAVNKVQSEVITFDMMMEALDKERTGNIQQNIDRLEKELKEILAVMKEEAKHDYTEQVNKVAVDLTNTNRFIHEVEATVKEHSDKFKEDEKEPEGDKDKQILQQGGRIIYGIPHDEVGNMLKLTKMEIQLKLKNNNEKLQEFADQYNGVLESINNLSEQIKAFNKKLAHNKADTQMLVEKNTSELKGIKKHVTDLGDRIQSQIPPAEEENEEEILFDSRKDSGQGLPEAPEGMDSIGTSAKQFFLEKPMAGSKYLDSPTKSPGKSSHKKSNRKKRDTLVLHPEKTLAPQKIDTIDYQSEDSETRKPRENSEMSYKDSMFENAKSSLQEPSLFKPNPGGVHLTVRKQTYEKKRKSIVSRIGKEEPKNKRGGLLLPQVLTSMRQTMTNLESSGKVNMTKKFGQRYDSVGSTMNESKRPEMMTQLDHEKARNYFNQSVGGVFASTKNGHPSENVDFGGDSSMMSKRARNQSHLASKKLSRKDHRMNQKRDAMLMSLESQGNTIPHENYRSLDVDTETYRFDDSCPTGERDLQQMTDRLLNALDSPNRINLETGKPQKPLLGLVGSEAADTKLIGVRKLRELNARGAQGNRTNRSNLSSNREKLQNPFQTMDGPGKGKILIEERPPQTQATSSRNYRFQTGVKQDTNRSTKHEGLSKREMRHGSLPSDPFKSPLDAPIDSTKNDRPIQVLSLVVDGDIPPTFYGNKYQYQKQLEKTAERVKQQSKIKQARASQASTQTNFHLSIPLSQQKEKRPTLEHPTEINTKTLKVSMPDNLEANDQTIKSSRRDLGNWSQKPYVSNIQASSMNSAANRTSGSQFGVSK